MHSLLLFSISEKSKCSKCEWFIIVVSLLSGIFIGVCLSCGIFPYFRRRSSTKRKSERKSTEQVENSTYQELDLTKINTKEDYQSLKKAKSQLSDSTYETLDLSKMNTPEENYQSLTEDAARGKHKLSNISLPASYVH